MRTKLDLSRRIWYFFNSDRNLKKMMMTKRRKQNLQRIKMKKKRKRKRERVTIKRRKHSRDQRVRARKGTEGTEIWTGKGGEGGGRWRG